MTRDQAIRMYQARVESIITAVENERRHEQRRDSWELDIENLLARYSEAANALCVLQNVELP